MDGLFEFVVDVAREQAAALKPVANPPAEFSPVVTHFVEIGGPRTNVYRAICGKSVHAREMTLRSSGKPTCERCSQLLAEFDAD